MNTLENRRKGMPWVREDSGNWHSVSNAYGPCSYRIERSGRRWELVRIRRRNKKMAKGESVEPLFATLDAAADAADLDYEREVDAWWTRKAVIDGAAKILRTRGMVDMILDACARVTKVPGAADDLRSNAVREKVEAEIEKLAHGRFR